MRFETTFVIAVLATWNVLVIWREGSLFAEWRARIEVWENKISELLMCFLCLSVWVSWGVVLVLFVLPDVLSDWSYYRYIDWICRLFVYGMAVSRCVNLANDIRGEPKNIFENSENEEEKTETSGSEKATGKGESDT